MIVRKDEDSKEVGGQAKTGLINPFDYVFIFYLDW